MYSTGEGVCSTGEGVCSTGEGCTVQVRGVQYR